MNTTNAPRCQQQFRLGDTVAWQMADGNTMTGRITALLGCYHSYDAVRPDGGRITLDGNRLQLRAATAADIDDAIRFWTHRA